MPTKPSPAVPVPTLSKLTIRRLNKIKKQILASPTQFQMGDVARMQASAPPPITIANCGTACCIAGWAAANAAKVKPDQTPAKVWNYHEAGGEALGITYDQAYKLFNFGLWPAQFRKFTRYYEHTPAFARQAARRIEHFIKTGGKE